MPCTTLLAGNKATNDGSAMMARTEDGGFDIKNFIVVNPEDQKKKYKCVISHLEIELPEKALGYTCTPNADLTIQTAYPKQRIAKGDGGFYAATAPCE